MSIHPAVTEIGSTFGRGKVFIYLVRGKEMNALIDTGSSDTPEKDILPVLKKLGMKYSDIDIILNTHGHFDHTGGNAVINKAGARIYCHPDEGDFIRNRQRCFREFIGPAFSKIMGSQEKAKNEWDIFTGIGGAEAPVDRLLKDGDIIDLGGDVKLKVIHLPGHTTGCLGFYWEQEGLLFPGDSLPGLHNEEGGLPILTRLDGYRQSLQKLQKMPLKYIMQAHAHRTITLGPIHLLDSKNAAIFLKESLDCADALEEAIKVVNKQGVPLMKLYDQVATRLPQSWKFKASSEFSFTPLNAFVILFNTSN